MPRAAAAYRFGPYEVRVESRELRKDGRKLKVRPQPFHVLQLLVERAPEIVTREELRERLWSPDTFVDFEHGLNTSIKELRGVLNDSATEPKYIETVPRLGYRMAAPVETESVSPAEAPQVPSTTAASAGEPRSRVFWPSWSARWAVVASALIVAIIVAFALLPRPRNRAPAATRLADGRIVMAVLPFETSPAIPRRNISATA